MKERQRQYLHAMGIQPWEPRYPPASTERAAATDVTPEAPAPQAAAEDKPSSEPSPPVAAVPAPDPAARESPPADTDIPQEYADWAMMVPEDSGNELDFELEPPRPEDRSARIGRMDWGALEAEVKDCNACELHRTRTQAVFGVGQRQAAWMIIGEAPGADEDRLGEPFVGRAGKLLDAMLLALGLRREQIYITNVLKSRPPKNRDPKPEEMQACWPYLQRQIELVGPKILLSVGRIATQTLLRSDLNIGRLRGRVHRFGAAAIPLVATYHPAYLLRSPLQKRKAWEDLQLAYHTFVAAPRRGGDIDS